MLLDRGVVVVDVHEPLEAMDRRVLAERRLDAIHHLAPVQGGPGERERHRVPVASGILVRVEAQVGELRVGQGTPVLAIDLQGTLGEQVADLLSQVA